MSLDAMIAEAVKEGVKAALAEMNNPRLLLRVEEAADMMAFGKDFVLAEVAAQRIRAVGAGKAMRIERAEIERWIANQRR